MEFLADTVAIIRHFAAQKNIGKSAKDIFIKAEKGEDVINISVISLMEIMYLSERNRIPINLTDTINRLNSYTNYKIIDLDVDVLKAAEPIKDLELHDRLIVATASYLNLAMLTKDEDIKKSGHITVIWD